MTRRIAFARVSVSYFIGMAATFPTKEVRTKPGMVQSPCSGVFWQVDPWDPWPHDGRLVSSVVVMPLAGMPARLA